ncbi:hypothetical protein DERF_008438 [Dermatophagoides farinae]|uniref:Uncharacterized protein n=1 Tax=Dermatophagoides farinae TaxID=6954 RepID=A0A922I3E8_DERFA|nr:hypothetical protein DERF_008438 [Dermatophagoides farinae]
MTLVETPPPPPLLLPPPLPLNNDDDDKLSLIAVRMAPSNCCCDCDCNCSLHGNLQIKRIGISASDGKRVSSRILTTTVPISFGNAILNC